MPVQQVREEPPSLLIRVSAACFQANALKQFGTKVRYALLTFGDVLGYFVLFGRGTRDVLSLGYETGAERFEPVPQTKRRHAVVLVIALDRFPYLVSDQIWQIELECLFHGTEA